MSAEPRRVLVLGTGALACTFAARLARAGTAVTVAGTWTEALLAIDAHGIRVREGAAQWTARVHTAAIDARLEPFPYALVLVKSYRTVRAAAALRDLLLPDGFAVTLQNGLGNREQLASTLGSDAVGAGVAFLGATVLGPGEVSAIPGSVVLDGGGSPVVRERTRTIAADLVWAGVAVELRADFAAVVWEKLAANCGINPLTALHGVTNGELLEDPVLRRTLEAAAREVAAVAAARGVRLERDAAEAAVAVARATGANTSSMRQDLERGAPTEIDALNGAVAAEGARLGVPTPVNLELFRGVRAREGRPLPEEVRS